MLNKNKLKVKKLYIDNDLIRKESAVQAILANKRKTERKQGTQIKIGYRKAKALKQICREERYKKIKKKEKE